MKQLLNLLKIKSLVTLLISIAVVYIAVRYGNVPEVLANAFLIIIGFYFGTQATKE